MLLYDNGSDERRVVILATSDNLNMLAESNSWFIDGTFSSAPQLFYQLLIFQTQIEGSLNRSWSLPVVYILLTNKDIPIYLEAFQALVSKAVLTNVNNLGYKKEYEAVTTDSTTGMVHHSTLYTWVRRLMMLAMVPTDNVPAVFNKIVEEIPDSLQLDPLLAYFERTWIQGMNGRPSRFPPAAWNQTDRVETNLNRTNNYRESYNNTFANVVGHSNPTIYNFLSAVQLEHAATEGKISCYRHNKPAPKRKNCYVEKDAEVKALVTTYHLYADNRVFEYLDLLAE